ncbi:MAG: hypothetical protein BJ554DRAFT_2071 [Olpidium bornovanus]|uniref:Uncharacterized protein n=1 Tax=Olpidium bornovanus TaxID=278681 RepID=A0A8H8A2P5_9FUNG|nr:MAG: hypothetical protein BJ554DRAFT_2071 [Olpidium bornovanus]
MTTLKLGTLVLAAAIAVLFLGGLFSAGPTTSRAAAPPPPGQPVVTFCRGRRCARGYKCINGVCQPRGEPRICGGFVGIECPADHLCLTYPGTADAFGRCVHL